MRSKNGNALGLGEGEMRAAAGSHAAAILQHNQESGFRADCKTTATDTRKGIITLLNEFFHERAIR